MVVENSNFKILKNNQSNLKKSTKGRNSTVALQQVVANELHIKPSIDCIKKANADITLSILEHYNSFEKLVPFLEEYSRVNPGFKYLLKKHDTDNNFEKVAILFEYSTEAIKHCYKVVGIDAAFLDTIGIDSKEKKLLQKMFPNDIPDDMEISFHKCVIIGLSGRTMNNEMILLGLTISYSENCESYDFFFKFLSDNKVYY